MNIEYYTPRVRKVGAIPAHWNGRSQSNSKTQEVHGICIHEIWHYIVAGNFTALYVKKEWDTVGEFLRDKMINDKGYISNVYKIQKRAGKSLVKFSHEIKKIKLADYSLDKLLLLYKELEDLWVKHDQHNVPPWFFGGDPFQQYLHEQLKEKHKVSDDDIAILLTPTKQSFSSEEERQIFGLALESIDSGCDFKDPLPPKILVQIEKLVKKYYWIPYGYDGPALYDADHYIRTIKEIIDLNSRQKIVDRISLLSAYEADMTKKHEALCVKYKIPAKIKRLVKVIHMLALMTDERKEYTFQAHESFHKILEALADKLGLKLIHLKFIVLDEIEKGKSNPAQLLKLAETRINGQFIIHWKDGACQLWDDKKTQEFIKVALPEEENKSELKGSVGSKGLKSKTTGKVRILMTQSEIDKLQLGEILVTQMTTPEYVPAMRKSLAIVTDEGGITCHAAIISRELNIPCVIGTKNATKVLHDGDLVEVDTDRGVVKIIK
jgi:phosphohistidine swiveling domain-containing protein